MSKKQITDRTMTLYHVSPARNEKSIRVHGLLCRFDRTARAPAAKLYLVTQAAIPWAIRHTMKRHGTEHVNVYQVRVRRSWLTQRPSILGAGGPRFWSCNRDIPPCRLTKLAHHTKEGWGGL